MAKSLQIIMPMAGAGSRFVNAGFRTPKPLIQVDGMPMFKKAISSLDEIDAEKKYFFVIQKQHDDKQKLGQLIKDALPEAQIIIIPRLTKGAAETALKAEKYLSLSDGLLIMDCDLWFKSSGYNHMVESSLANANDISAGLLTFKSDNPRYSFAKIIDKNKVVRTAEKKVISTNAIAGAYFFSSAEKFIDTAHSLLKEPINKTMPEYYISLLYNIILNSGEKVNAAPVDKLISFGTPEELSDYQANHN